MVIDQMNPAGKGPQTTTIFNNGHFVVERDSAGGYILHRSFKGNVYIQPGDDAATFSDSLQDALESEHPNAVVHFLSEYF